MRSLRSRLVAGILLVLAVVGLVAGTFVSHYVDDSEREALDDRLQRTAELSRATARAAVQESLPDSDRRLDAVLSATGSSLRLLLGETVLLETGRAPASRPRPVIGFRTFTARDGARHRAFATTLRDEELGGLAVIEVATPLASLEARQSDLDRRLLVLGLVALLVAGLGTWLAADLVLRPLRRLRAAAAGIASDEDLEAGTLRVGGPQEVRSLAASFDAMLARLGRSAADRERALEATRRFAADAGHELRTPLTSVLTTLSVLSRHPGMSDEQRAGIVGDALAEHRRLVELLDGLQALARGDAMAVEEADVDLVEVAGAAAEGLRARHPSVELDVEMPGAPVAVRGWEQGLRLLVDNLLENAARHGGRRVRLSLVERTLVVEDDGPGIPEADRRRILEPFVRVEGNENPGSGLGLALVAQQVRHHGGTLEVGDSDLGGARFTVSL